MLVPGIYETVYQDAKNAVEYILNDSYLSDFNINVSKSFLIGHCSGAALALFLCKQTFLYQGNSFRFLKQVSLAGMINFSSSFSNDDNMWMDTSDFLGITKETRPYMIKEWMKNSKYHDYFPEKK
jgi:hypothetical protein